MRTRIGIIASILLVAGLGAAYFFRGELRDLARETAKQHLPPAQSAKEAAQTPANTSIEDSKVLGATTEESSSPAPLPTQVNLAVPFTPQAPFANWDTLHEEACEEAAALMVHWYYQGKKSVTPEEADAAIHNFVDSENAILGFYEDTDADQLVQVIQKKWGYKNVRILENPTVDELKRQLADGHPVIVLAAGRMLGNPYYKQPGPIYHALVLKGYTQDGKIITNDPGTKRGADYLYDPNMVLNVMHEWNGGDVEHGRKMAIVIEQ